MYVMKNQLDSTNYKIMNIIFIKLIRSLINIGIVNVRRFMLVPSH